MAMEQEQFGGWAMFFNHRKSGRSRSLRGSLVIFKDPDLNLHESVLKFSVIG
ncbi:MAG: hypothetical protein ACI9NQ_001503 [Paracoccaceae bacterium]|jgi:hypothetical protein